MSASAHAYVHLCVWWNPPLCLVHPFFWKNIFQWPHPPSIYPINSQAAALVSHYFSLSPPPPSVFTVSQSAPNWFCYLSNSISPLRVADVLVLRRGCLKMRCRNRENKETARSTDTELWSVMEEDDIIVSGQSCSHRSHAALTHSFAVCACTYI